MANEVAAASSEPGADAAGAGATVRGWDPRSDCACGEANARRRRELAGRGRGARSAPGNGAADLRRARRVQSQGGQRSACPCREPRPSVTNASFRPRFQASCMPVFIPCAPTGLWMCAARRGTRVFCDIGVWWWRTFVTGPRVPMGCRYRQGDAVSFCDTDR